MRLLTRLAKAAAAVTGTADRLAGAQPPLLLFFAMVIPLTSHDHVRAFFDALISLAGPGVTATILGLVLLVEERAVARMRARSVT